MGVGVKLTEFSKSAGCAAKIGPGVLAEVVGRLPSAVDENLIVGVETADDAAVYRVSDEVALIQTVDFFPPMVDDPYTFGQIAAANALSDVYAMGGEPRLALNVVAFPNCLGAEVLGEILAGGASKVQEAGAVLAGGHSINDEEPKYGLCVSGFVHPDRIWKNGGAQAGDVLLLTKPLGVGLINTAVKAGMASAEAEKKAVESMSCLNKMAMEVLREAEVHSCTDVTGFGINNITKRVYADHYDIRSLGNITRNPPKDIHFCVDRPDSAIEMPNAFHATVLVPPRLYDLTLLHNHSAMLDVVLATGSLGYGYTQSDIKGLHGIL